MQFPSLAGDAASPVRLFRVPAVEDHDIAVRVPDKTHLADASVLDTNHLAPGAAHFFYRRIDVGDPKSDSAFVGNEHLAILLRHPKRQRQTRRLCFARSVRAYSQPEHVPIPRDRARPVTRRDRHEIHLFDLHYCDLSLPAILLLACAIRNSTPQLRSRTWSPGNDPREIARRNLVAGECIHAR